MLVIPGGRAPEHIRTDPDVAHIVKHFFDRALPVGTICHSPQVPAALGLLRGRTTAAYPPLKADVRNAGATFVDGAMVSCRGGPTCPSGRARSCRCWTGRASRPDVRPLRTFEAAIPISCGADCRVSRSPSAAAFFFVVLVQIGIGNRACC
ncbi:DJ-1/PfpI family protein [Kibdelosporangium aridum]|uniref:DJ-1/PfpI family protein n=1 Tax=Kibdelosporangium aridum TaxID=2030 RepID=UPI0038993A2E